MPTQRVRMAEAKRRTVLVVYLVSVVLVGVVVLVWAIPPAWDFMSAAPREFWLVAILAVVADTRPFVQRQSSRWPSRIIISVCFTFAIFLLWGAAPAIVIQVVAACIAALRLRLSLVDGAFLVARLVCAFAAAALTVRLFEGLPDIAIGAEIDRYDVIATFEPALAWLVVDYGLVFLARATAGLRGDRRVRRGIWYDVLGTAGLLLLSPVLVTAPTGWSIALIAIPLLALGQYSRLFADQERRLNRDPVTNVLSRRGLVTEFEAMTASDEWRRDDPLPFGVMLVILDGFAYINQNLGRHLAEKVITEAARRMRSAVGENNRVGRIGGEVFVVLNPGLVERDARDSATALARELGEPMEVEGLPFALDPTVGVALSPQHGRDFSTLMGKAESAATEARSQREPARVYVQETLDATQARVVLLSDLRAVLTDPNRAPEITILYQPQVDIDSGRTVAVEALMRWTHPQWGPVRTDELIQATEPSEVMQLLTRRIIGDVTAQLAAWNEAGIQLRAAVNVSVRDLGTEGFSERLRAELVRHSLPAAQLQIEITEGMLLADSARLIRVTQSLAAMGVSLALDDFGTGFASLQQLRMFPLSEVKIDRSYVSRMTSGGAERAIVEAINALARALELRVVAEGVEDEQTAALLAAMPGIVGQGWYFARPMPASELVKWLHSREEYAAHGPRGR